MNISVVGPGTGDAFNRMLAQARYFQSQGYQVQVYVASSEDVQAPENGAGIALVAVESLTHNPPAHWTESEVYIYHDPGPRALLESVRQIRRGLVMWACHALPDPALIHYADLCIVETPQLRAQLNAQWGYSLERIFVIQPSEDETHYGERLNAIVTLALQDALPRAELPVVPAQPARPPSRFDRLESQADVMLRGYRVHSKIPLLGGLIAWTRKTMTSHLREPYLDPTLERQVAFNHRLVREMRALAASQDDIVQRLAHLESSKQPLNPVSPSPDRLTGISERAVGQVDNLPCMLPRYSEPQLAETTKVSDAETVIEIRDPAIDQDAVTRRLRTQVDQRRAGGAYDIDPTTFPPEALRPRRVEEPAASEMPATFPGLNEAVVELAAQSRLSEPHFNSPAPIIGPLIVAVRRAWNWMSTKWYVLPIIQHQSELNARQITLLSELAHWQEIQVQHTAELQARIEELENRLAALGKEEIKP